MLVSQSYRPPKGLNTTVPEEPVLIELNELALSLKRHNINLNNELTHQKEVIRNIEEGVDAQRTQMTGLIERIQAITQGDRWAWVILVGVAIIQIFLIIFV